MTGCLIAIIVISVWSVTKAALEAFYFKDRKDAKQTLFRWLLSMGSIGLAFGFSLLIDYLG